MNDFSSWEKFNDLIFFQNVFWKKKGTLWETNIPKRSVPVILRQWSSNLFWQKSTDEILPREDFEKITVFAEKILYNRNFFRLSKNQWSNPFSKGYLREKKILLEKNFPKRHVSVMVCQEMSNFLWLKSATENFSRLDFKKSAFLRKKAFYERFFLLRKFRWPDPFSKYFLK